MAGSLARFINSTARSMRAGLAEVVDKEVRFLKGNTNGGKHHGKAGRLVPSTLACRAICAARLRMGQAGAGEDGQLLSANQGVQSVDGGYARSE